MKKIKIQKNCVYYRDNDALCLYDRVMQKDYHILEVFKDDQRSYVALIEIDEKKYVLKIPTEKNKRKWQRFLSIFRGSESYREFVNINKIKELGFKAPTPYLAVEERKFGFICVDSFYLSSYIDGREATVKNIEVVSKELEKIHKKGYLHGDSHIANFLISGRDVYIIDTKFMRNKYGGFGKVFEFIYLEESCEQDIEYNKNSFYYKAAMIFKRYLLWLGRFKKRLRGQK